MKGGGGDETDQLVGKNKDMEEEQNNRKWKEKNGREREGKRNRTGEH